MACYENGTSKVLCIILSVDSDGKDCKKDRKKKKHYDGVRETIKVRRSKTKSVKGQQLDENRSGRAVL